MNEYYPSSYYWRKIYPVLDVYTLLHVLKYGLSHLIFGSQCWKFNANVENYYKLKVKLNFVIIFLFSIRNCWRHSLSYLRSIHILQSLFVCNINPKFYKYLFTSINKSVNIFGFINASTSSLHSFHSSKSNIVSSNQIVYFELMYLSIAQFICMCGVKMWQWLLLLA